MAEPEKNFLQQWIYGLPGWKATFNQLQEHFGSLVAVLLLVLAGVGFIWWISKDIKERPGVEWVIKRFKRRVIDKAPAGVLIIAVAHLQDDEGQKQEKLLLDELKHFNGAETLTVDRVVKWPASGTGQAKKNKAEEKARGLLRKTGADVLIWGSVISLSGGCTECDLRHAVRPYPLTGSGAGIDWLLFCHRRRLHATLGYLSPMAFQKKRLADKERLAASSLSEGGR